MRNPTFVVVLKFDRCPTTNQTLRFSSHSHFDGQRTSSYYHTFTQCYFTTIHRYDHADACKLNSFLVAQGDDWIFFWAGTKSTYGKSILIRFSRETFISSVFVDVYKFYFLTPHIRKFIVALRTCSMMRSSSSFNLFQVSSKCILWD